MDYRKQAIIEQYLTSQKNHLTVFENHILSGNAPDRNILEITEKLQTEELEVLSSVLRAQDHLLALRECKAGSAVPLNSYDDISAFKDSLIKKYSVKAVPCADKRGNTIISGNGNGKVLIAGNNDEYRKAVSDYFKGKNYKTLTAGPAVTENEAESLLSGDVSGLVIIGRETSYTDIVSAFLMCREFGKNAGSGSADTFIVFVTFMGGKLGIENITDEFISGSFSGMAKTLSKEYDGVTVKLIDFEHDLSAERLISLFDDELHYRNTETGRYKDERYCLSLEKCENGSHSVPAVKFTPDDVIVVSGGARGVTASCITKLSEHICCRIVILGRTVIPEDYHEDDELSAVNDLNGLKKYFAQKWKREGVDFVLRDAEKKAKEIMNIRAVRKTMADIERNNCKVYYYPCNINDSESMSSVMKKVRNEIGQITGIVHGAGVILDSEIRKKETSAFELVFGTKFRGLLNLVGDTDTSGLKLVTVFSSIAGLFGNKGQVDYASGNSFMDKFIRHFGSRHPECRCVSFNWSAWDGGMVDSTYSKALKSRGIVLIPVPTGAEYFASEILYGNSEQLLISNELSGEMK